MMVPKGRVLKRLLGCAVLAAVICGCAARPAPTAEQAAAPVAPAHAAAAPVAPITNTDACATRLHDICGRLLLYYARQGELPADLAELGATEVAGGPGGGPGGGGGDALSCPVSGLPYVYRPGGILLAERGQLLVLHDPAPSHAGMRWAVCIDEPRPGEPLVTKVVALPESFFLLHRPTH